MPGPYDWHQRMIRSWPCQAAFWVLTVGHCSIYMLGPSVFGDLSTFAMVVWATGVPLVIMTVLEVGVRTAAQAGPLWRFRTWQKMMIPLYHQLEAFVLALAAYRGGMSVYLLVVAVAGQNMATNVSDADKATVLVLLGYRALRNWGDWHEVSVQTTLRLRRKRSKSNKPWMDEYNRQLANNSERFFVRMQRCIDTRASQLVLFSAAVLYCILELEDFVRSSQVLGYVLLVAICLEFLARAKAQDGERFFRPWLNKLELVLLASGAFCLFYSSWYTNYLAQSKEEATAVATATACLLLLHRCIRLLAIRFQVSGGEFHQTTLMNAKAMEIFMAKFGDLVEVPPTNIHVDLPGSLVHIEKASLKAEVFRELHLPLAITGGLIEDLLIDFFASESTGARTGRTKVRIKNLLLVLGPGPGLAEAGGSRGSYWQQQRLVEAKNKVVDLLYTRIGAPFPEQIDRASLSVESLGSRGSKGSKSSWMAWLRQGRNKASPSFSGGFGFARALRYRVGMALNSGMRRFRVLLQDSSMRHLDLQVQNAQLQFQDSDGCLGQGFMSIGVKVDSVRAERHAGKSLSLQAARLVLRVEPWQRQESWQKRSISKWKPESVVKKMVRLNYAERLRSWMVGTMEETGAGPLLERLEKWQRQNVLTISQVTLTAGPKHLRPKEEAKTREKADSGGFVGSLRDRVTRVTQLMPKRDRKEQDLASQLFGEDTRQWQWRVQVRPVWVTLDNMQLQCMAELNRCTRSWLSWDASFRWRPDLSPLDARLQGASPAERKVVVRFWWFYALHRVLAREGRRLKLGFLELVLQAGYRFKYRTTLSSVVQQSGPLIPGGKVVLKPSPQQKEQLRDLRMHLSYPDIIACLRQELATAVHRLNQTNWKPPKPVDEDLDSDLSSETSETTASEAESEGSEAAGAEQEEPNFCGSWEVGWAALEVWLLFYRPFGHRPVLLHVNCQSFHAEAEILPPEARDYEEGGRLVPFGLLCSLQAFTVQSPASARQCQAALDVVKITRGCRLVPEMLNQEHPGLGAKHLNEDRAGLLQARSISGRQVELAVRLPQVRLLLFEPLLLTLRSFHRRSKDSDPTLAEGSSWQSDLCRISAVNGRQGPLKTSVVFETSEAWELRKQAARAHQRTLLSKQLQKAQRFFERATVLQEDLEVDLVLHLKSIHIFQVGPVSKRHLGVEEARLFPQIARFSVAKAAQGKSFGVSTGPDLLPGGWSPDAWLARPGHFRCHTFRAMVLEPCEPPEVEEDPENRWCCCCDTQEPGPVPVEPMPRREALMEPALLQVSFSKLLPAEFDHWLGEQEAEWHHQVSQSRRYF